MHIFCSAAIAATSVAETSFESHSQDNLYNNNMPASKLRNYQWHMCTNVNWHLYQELWEEFFVGTGEDRDESCPIMQAGILQLWHFNRAGNRQSRFCLASLCCHMTYENPASWMIETDSYSVQHSRNFFWYICQLHPMYYVRNIWLILYLASNPKSPTMTKKSWPSKAIAIRWK